MNDNIQTPEDWQEFAHCVKCNGHYQDMGGGCCWGDNGVYRYIDKKLILEIQDGENPEVTKADLF